MCTHGLLLLSTFIKEASFCNEWWLIQRLTISWWKWWIISCGFAGLKWEIYNPPHPRSNSGIMEGVGTKNVKTQSLGRSVAELILSPNCQGFPTQWCIVSNVYCCNIFPLSFLFIKIYWFLGTDEYWRYTCAMVYMWGSEDNFWEWVLFFHHVETWGSDAGF